MPIEVLYAIAIPLAVIGVFFICRELVLWYFRINHMAESLRNIENLLAKLIADEDA